MRNSIILGGTAALALALAACGDDTGGAGGSGAGGDDATSTTSGGTTSSTTSGGTTSGSTTNAASTGSGEGGSGDGGAGGSGDGGSGDGGGGGQPSAVSIVPCDGADIAAEIGTSGLNYDPEALAISVGDTIRFTPTGSHDMTSDDDLFATPLGEVACLTFGAAGEYPFHCSLHGVTMDGVVTVQ